MALLDAGRLAIRASSGKGSAQVECRGWMTGNPEVILKS
jgi:hypothetical protein